jgi:hypothetical protein
VAGPQRSRLIDSARPTRTGPRSEKQERGSAVDTWSETRSLIVLMTVIAVFYVLGRVVAEML